jgi:GxxExxY protein
MTHNQITEIVVDCAIKLHTDLGPGLYEVVYKAALFYLLHKRVLSCKRQVPITFTYDGITFDEGFRADIIVNDIVLLEIKSVESLNAAHKKQIQTYLKLSTLKLGLILNFGQAYLKDGIVRTVNNL